jgi:hypothetical protein
MYIGLHVKYPLYLSDFNETWIFSTKFHEIRAVGAELFHADGQTDVAKLIVAFCNLANAPKKCQHKLEKVLENSG